MVERVLVVDDHLDTAEAIKMVLGITGHDVRVATSGREAVEIARDYRPSLAFIDISLPDMSGYELARILRSCVKRLIGVSGRAEVLRTNEHTFDRRLLKPFDAALLINECALAR